MPVAGSAKITLFRAGRARHAVVSATRYRRVGVVRRTLRKGRNVVTVKRIRKLPRGRYRATITATAAGQRLVPIRLAFTIRR